MASFAEIEFNSPSVAAIAFDDEEEEFSKTPKGFAAPDYGTVVSTPRPDTASPIEGQPDNPLTLAKEGASNAFAQLGNIARAVPADIAAGISGQTQFTGNVPAALAEESALPIDTALKIAAEEGGAKEAVIGKLGQGIAATAPLMVAGALPVWAQRLVALGFSAHMISQAPEIAKGLGEEMGKNPDERDLDKLTTLISDGILTGAFAPLAAAHGGSRFVESKVAPKTHVARELAEQLKNAPLEIADKTPPAIRRLGIMFSPDALNEPGIRALSEAAMREASGEKRIVIPGEESAMNAFSRVVRPPQVEGVSIALVANRPEGIAGGNISFAAPAEARGIPSARQSGLDINQPTLIPEPALERVPIIGPDAASYRRPSPPPTQEQYNARVRRENVEKGLYDPNPPLEPLAQEVYQYPAEGMPTGTLSNLQRQRILAGKENVRTNVRNNPPQSELRRDIARYNDIQKQMESLSSDINAPDFSERLLSLWGQNEAIKNKYGGMPPKMPEANTATEFHGMGGAIPGEFQSAPRTPFAGIKGWASKAPEVAQKLREFFTPPNPTVAPEIVIKEGQLLPRFQTPEIEKHLASTPHGMAKVPGLGVAVDPRASAKSPEDISIITRAAMNSKADTFASIWAQTQWQFKDVFPVDRSTGSFPLTNGKRGYLSDVIEAELRDPGSQPLTHAQWQWVHQEWVPIKNEINRILQEEGIRKIETSEIEYDPKTDYFPRPVVGKRNRIVDMIGSGRRPGSKQFYEKKRRYITEEEGARPPREGEKKEEIIYDPDPISRVTKFISGAYRSVADHRLANDPALGGVKVSDRYAELKSKHADKMGGMNPAERAEFEAQLWELAAYTKLGIEKQLSIAPAFQGKIFPIEVAKKLETAYGENTRAWVRKLSNFSTAVKAMQATLDLSAPVIQGGAVMFRHPKAWAKAASNSVRALTDPNVLGKLMDNPEFKTGANQFSQSGGSIFQLQDFLSGMKEGSVISKIPLYGKATQATGRAFGVFLDVAKVELWNAWSKVTPKSEWGKLAETIENSLFSGRMEQIGINEHRAVGERLMMFAPSYYRGAGGLVSTAFQRGVSGKVARQMLGSYMMGGLLVTVAAQLAVGLSWDEITDRLNPSKGKFMKIPIPVGGGKRVEFGFGNIIPQLIRLSGEAVEYHTSDNPIDTGVEANPYLKFLRAKSALLPSIATTLATGRDYFGNRITAKEAAARMFAPFIFNSMFPRDKATWTQRAADTAFSFFGFSAFPESEYSAQLRLMNEMADKEFKQDFKSLKPAQRAIVVREFQKSADYQKRDTTPLDMERFIHLNEQRRREIEKSINPELAEKLKRLGLDVGGYKSTLRINKQDVPLTAEEHERYQQLLSATYNQFIERLNEKRFESLPALKKEKEWQELREKIGEIARKKLVSELNRNRD